MKNALILANVVQNIITSACPNPQDYQAVVDVTNVYCEPGWTWNGGTSFTKVVPVEVTNQKTLEQQADAALVSNLQVIADVNAFMSGAGAGTANLTLGQLSAFARQIAPAVKALAQQNNGVIRLLRGALEATT